MTALRTTRPETDRCRRPARPAGRRKDFPLALGLGVLLAGLTGCGSRVAEGDAAPVVYRPYMTPVPPPTVDQVRYNTDTRTLTFAEQSGPARWMVKRADAPTAYPVGPEHTLPEGTDPAETFVFFARPGGGTSRGLSLADILAAGPEHRSAIR